MGNRLAGCVQRGVIGGLGMERVSRAEAARKLGLNKSTVTRWVQEHPALLNDDGTVSLDQLRAHRDLTVNPKLVTRGPQIGPSEGAAPVPAGRAGANGLNDVRSRTESAKAESAELDLAERLNLTLRRDEVEEAVAAAGQMMKQIAQRLVRERAEAMARIHDDRQMERALDEFVREILAAGAQSLMLATLSTQEDSAA